MDKVYIISRYRGVNNRQQEFNVAVARYFAREAIIDNKIPIVPHIYFTQLLDDSDEAERAYGLELGIEALRQCDEFLLVIIDGIISDGMKAEIAEISRLGLPGRIVSLTKREVTERIRKHLK